MRAIITKVLLFNITFLSCFKLGFKGAFAFSCLLFPFLSLAQSLDVVNKGLQIKNTNDSVVIFGDVYHDGIGSAQDGTIENDGHFYIAGDWINNNSTSGQIFTSGRSGWVHLDSAVQTISGTSVTRFNKLELGGDSDSTKFLVGVNAEVEDTLALNNHQFNVDVNTVTVLGVDTFLITRTSGYVSSTDEGGLARNTANTQTYLFPVGSSIGTMRYRPVDILPQAADPNTYKVGMRNNDPDIDNFPRATKEATVGEVNDKFYHKVSRTNGVTPIDITVYFHDSADVIDGIYDILANWADEWKNPGEVGTAVTNYGLAGVKTTSFDNFVTTPSTPVALSYDVLIDGQIFVANIFSPNGDGFNDFLFARGKALISVEFVVYDRWGAKVFETNDITKGWDGTKNGKPLNTAVFVYVVRGKFKNGDEVTKKGNVTLLK